MSYMDKLLTDQQSIGLFGGQTDCSSSLGSAISSIWDWSSYSTSLSLIYSFKSFKRWSVWMRFAHPEWAGTGLDAKQNRHSPCSERAQLLTVHENELPITIRRISCLMGIGQASKWDALCRQTFWTSSITAEIRTVKSNPAEVMATHKLFS